MPTISEVGTKIRHFGEKLVIGKSRRFTCSFKSHISTSKKKILIIDDNAEQLYLVEAILALGDYHTVTALSGEEALHLLVELDELNLILLDMTMPDMSGPEFLLLLEEKLPEILKTVPIVFFTAMDKVPLSKATGFIRKPFVFDNFLKAVSRFIEKGVDPGHFHQ